MDTFLDQADLATTTRRVYGASLAAFAQGVEQDSALVDLGAAAVASWFADRYAKAAPATWNRELATLSSVTAWWARQGWLEVDPTVTLERRRGHATRARALTRRQW